MAKIMDMDFVFISYNEPNKEENYADLVNKVPWAKRVDGVEGFDSAHKAAAKLADTEFFISVDDDNIIDESFLIVLIFLQNLFSKYSEDQVKCQILLIFIVSSISLK